MLSDANNVQSIITDTIELSDETGAVKNLRNYPYDYGVDYLKEREILVLLKVENAGLEETDSDRITFVPLLAGMDDNKEFLDVLNPKPEELELPTRSRTSRSNSSVDADDIRAMIKFKAKPKSRRKSEIKGLAPRLLLKQKLLN
ncbi:hypothetical protein ScPMuIL_013625 [Solemya velum]